MQIMTEDERIERDVSLIVSTGRTGTRFLGQYLGRVIEDCTSFHEPDMLSWHRKGKLQKIYRFGLYQTIIGKIFDRAGLRALGLKYLSGQTSAHNTAEGLIRHRKHFYKKQTQSLIVEAYSQWYAVLDVLPLVFRNYRVGAIIRDPRSWLASADKWRLWWHSGDLVTRLGLLRLRPDLVGDKAAAAGWQQMTAFSRMAWSWNTINSILTAQALTDPAIRMFRFEDLFGHTRQSSEVGAFLDFITDFGDQRHLYSLSSFIESPRVHASQGESSVAWKRWDRESCLQVNRLCGPLMRRWGYGLEKGWLNRIKT